MWVFGISPCALEYAFPSFASPLNTSSILDMFSKPKEEPKEKADNRWVTATQKIRHKQKDTDFKSNCDNHTSKCRTGTVAATVCKDSQMRKVVEKAVLLDSEENMAVLWTYFALFLDRVLFYINFMIVIGVIVTISPIH